MKVGTEPIDKFYNRMMDETVAVLTQDLHDTLDHLILTPPDKSKEPERFAHICEVRVQLIDGYKGMIRLVREEQARENAAHGEPVP